jgi:sulfur-oxidizing protein SoxY
MNRRDFLKRAAFAGVIASAVSAGLALPKRALAAWNAKAFKSDSTANALTQMYGTADLADSDKVYLTAPAIAENGAVVPLTVQTDLPNVESIALMIEENPNPLAANFKIGKGMKGYVSTRVKMGTTTQVHAIVHADGKLMKASKEVKVTIGGCGG